MTSDSASELLWLAELISERVDKIAAINEKTKQVLAKAAAAS